MDLVMAVLKTESPADAAHAAGRIAEHGDMRTRCALGAWPIDPISTQ